MNSIIGSFDSVVQLRSNRDEVDWFGIMSSCIEPVESEISRERENEISQAFIDRMKDRKKLNSFLKKYNNLANIKEANMKEFVWLHVTEGCEDEFSDTNKMHILSNVYRHLLNYVI